MGRIRVMQSFGEPRATTNPYIVQLRSSLLAEESVEHLPFSWRMALIGRYDVLHVHWPDTLLAAGHWWTRAGKRAAMAALILRLRFGRVAVVRTVHNVTPPSGPPLDRALVRALDRRADLHIRISASTPESPGTASVLIPHGHYRDWFERMPQASPVPKRLGYVGMIKPYKGVEALLEAFAEASVLDDAISLRVAGKPSDEDVARVVRDAAARMPGLEVTLRYVSEEEFVEVVTSSELVVLPYRFMHNSGAALAALSLARPVLVPANDTNRALAAEVGPGWVHLFEGDLDADDLRAALSDAESGGRSDAPDMTHREWDDVGARHAAAYRRAVARRTSSTPAQISGADEETRHA